MALTRRQKEFLDFLADFVEEHGYCPSYDEIAQGLQLASLATVHKHVGVLEGRGYIKRGANQSRSLELSPAYLERRRPGATRGDPRALDVPLLGRIAAGRPLEAVAGEERLALSEFAGAGDTFALEVRGDSMIEDHICDGDFVVVERGSTARDGEIVVALIKGTEATLKRMYRESDGRIRLQPANAAMAPIFVYGGDLRIQGRVLAVLRKY